MGTRSSNRFDVIILAARKREESQLVSMAYEPMTGAAHSLAAALKGLSGGCAVSATAVKSPSYLRESCGGEYMDVGPRK